jgi:hypothetical protein
MFDTDAENGSYGPRQGCAVFQTAILAAMSTGPGDPAFRDFVAFTAIHEIGHAFNLWHVDGNSFMQPHPNPPNVGTCDFDNSSQNSQYDYLALASDATYANFVLPGGTPFGVRADGFKGDDDAFAIPSVPIGKLSLKIALSHNTFWSFEPVELDIELSIAGSKPKTIDLPDELDPGYRSFQIWITRPNGERFRFRPQFRFCQSNGRRSITKDKPFRRDISIFRQSGGYTFSTPGQYQVEAIFVPESGPILKSNKVECQVLPAKPKSATWKNSRNILQTSEAQKILRYKHRLPSHHVYSQILKYADKDASVETAATIYYALGKALVRTVEMMPKGSRNDSLRLLGKRHLQKVFKLGNSSHHRMDATKALFDVLK